MIRYPIILRCHKLSDKEWDLGYIPRIGEIIQYNFYCEDDLCYYKGDFIVEKIYWDLEEHKIIILLDLDDVEEVKKNDK